jgi:hypothetical protein
VLKVYVKDIQRKKRGDDYIVGTGGHEGEVIFSASTYSDISFKRHGSFRREDPGAYRQTLNQDIRSTAKGPTR